QRERELRQPGLEVPVEEELADVEAREVEVEEPELAEEEVERKARELEVRPAEGPAQRREPQFPEVDRELPEVQVEIEIAYAAARALELAHHRVDELGDAFLKSVLGGIDRHARDRS